MTRTRPITIIGAGPAGLTAAITLASAGYRVVVHEQHADVGQRFHGDLQGLENWSSEEDALDTLRTIGVEPVFYWRPVRIAHAYGPRSQAEFGSESPLFYLLKRGSEPDSLDSALKHQALRAGVEIQFNRHVEHREGDIIATGPKVARIIAVGVVFDTDLTDTARVLLGDVLAPKGYSYLLASDGRGTLAATLFDRFGEGKLCFERSLRRFQELVGLTINNPRPFTGYGTLWDPRPANAGEKIYAGEAAGFQDNLFGFGIRYAMTTGYLAARSIIDRVSYHTLWSRHLGRRLRTSLINRFAFELLGQCGYDYLVTRTGRAKDPKRLWMRYYNMSLWRPWVYPAALLFSRFRHRSSRP